MLARRFFAACIVSSVAIVALGAAAACGSSSSSADPGVSEGGGDGDLPDTMQLDVQVTNPNEAKQKGRVIDALSKFGVTNPVITVGSKSVTGNADGMYEIIVPKNKPYSMSVTAEDHWKLNEQEWILKTDFVDRMDTALLSTSIANVLATLLPPRDKAKGILVVHVAPLPPCASEAGSVISIAPAGSAKITYFSGGKPDKTVTSAVAGESFSAAITDVEPGINVVVKADSPTCELVAFPVDYQGVTYTGNQKAEAGNVLSYLRVFVGPPKIVDGGGD